MDQLIEELIFKRLCINKNNDLEFLKKGLIKSNLCKCNLSNHIACVFYEKNKSIIKLNVGINNYNKNQSTTQRPNAYGFRYKLPFIEIIQNNYD